MKGIHPSAAPLFPVIWWRAPEEEFQFPQNIRILGCFERWHPAISRSLNPNLLAETHRQAPPLLLLFAIVAVFQSV